MPRGPRPQLRRQRGHDLELGSGDDRAQTELRRRAGQAGRNRRLGLVGGHPGKPRPIAVDQPDAAERATLGEDRHTGGAQLLDVAVDRPDRDLELARELGRGQAATALEQQQQVDEAAGTHLAIA